ncbi:MAG: hypothetical protein WC527_00105 [Candidatus Margulisiibacteriota bacterium]
MGRLFNKKIVFFASIAAILFVAGTSYASLMFRQPSLKLMLKQGQSFNGGIVLENVSDKPLKVHAEFVDTIDKDGKAVPRACSKWIRLPENDFVIPPNSIKDLKLNIKVPKNASGGYWTAIVYSYYNGQMKGPEDMTFNIRMHIEMPINIQISDTVKNDLSADNIEIVYSPEKTLTAKAKVKNTGNSFTEAKLMSVVFGPDGKIADKFISEKFKIYPDEEKELSYSKKLELSKGAYKAVFMLDYEGGELKAIEKEFAVN